MSGKLKFYCFAVVVKKNMLSFFVYINFDVKFTKIIAKSEDFQYFNSIFVAKVPAKRLQFFNFSRACSKKVFDHSGTR